jgi:hypothetical protein
MFELLSSHDWRGLLVREGPALLVSLALAEAFYKFHSFTLECTAFLATWYALSWCQAAILGHRK